MAASFRDVARRLAVVRSRQERRAESDKRTNGVLMAEVGRQVQEGPSRRGSLVSTARLRATEIGGHLREDVVPLASLRDAVKAQDRLIDVRVRRRGHGAARSVIPSVTGALMHAS